MKNILIIAHECAPYNRPGSTIGAQRPFQFAKHLSEIGNKVIVLTCDWRERRVLNTLQGLKEKVNQQIESQLNSRLIYVKVPSLTHADWLDKIWWRTVNINPALGTFKVNGSRLMIAVRKIATLIKLFRGDYSQSWQKPAFLASDEIVNQFEIDVVIAEHGPDASLYIANHIYKTYQIPWLVDFRDPAERGLSKLLRPLYIYQVRQLVISASCLVNVTPIWAQMDEVKYKKNCYCIPNGYDKQEFELSEIKIDKRYFNIVYTGSIQKSQNIELFLDGFKVFIDKINNVQDVKFTYFGSSNDRVSKKVSELGIDKWVKVGSLVSRNIALNEILNAEILLILSIDASRTNDSLINKGVYPGKVFEYFAVGKPILNVPGDSGVLDELIRTTNTGVTLNTKDSISDYLDKIYSDFKCNKSSSFSPNKDEVDKYSRFNQSKILDEILNDCLVCEKIMK